MSKEIKIKENAKAQKGSIKIYAIIAILVAIFAVLVILKPNADIKTTNVVTSETSKLKDEKAIARIDIYSQLVNADRPLFEVYLDGSEFPEQQAIWMPKFGSQGYMIENNNGMADIVIKVLQDTNMNIILKGLRDVQNDNLIPHWVKYTTFKINEREILQEPRDIWYDKAYTHTLDVKAGEEYKIHIEWTNTDK